jgi:4-amino-4-deoxy-L-arabinose transferase-like glycosyltransferase
MTAPHASSADLWHEPLPGTPTPSRPKPTATPAPELTDPLSTRHMWIAFLLLTALAAFLRFWRLDHQAYWTDEGYTILRTRDSFYNMLSNLTDQGFPPGWYSLIRWWRIILQERLPAADAFAPQYLRLLPAFVGTLTVPAMYLLGRQFTDRKGALLVMLLAAVNPFLIYYARDIKMYAGLYFFATLNMALFFQWQTSRRHLLYFPLFLLSGVAMTATHSMGWVLIALQLIFVLTRPRPRPWDVPLWVLSVGAMAVIPLYWFYQYTQPARWESRLTTDTDHGMGWITMYTDMSWRTLAGLPTSHILGYLWPVYPPNQLIDNWFLLGGNDFVTHLNTRSWPWMANGQLYVAYALFAIMFLGLIPWRGIRRNPERAVSSTRSRWWWVLLWIALPSTALALTWIPPNSPWFDTIWQGWNPKPLWEPRYLGILVPAWLLWLAASLRRLPTVWVRAPLIIGVAGVCAYSSLSNHLVYRNAPFNVPAEILEKYIDNTNRASAAVAVPPVKYADPAENFATTIARHVVPGSREDQAYSPYPSSHMPVSPPYWPTNLNSPAQILSWVRSSVVGNSRLKLLVLTDRYGDLPKDQDIISNDALQRLLGDRWELVQEEKYEWHYEWRFYIFHTWRTRVWKLKS